MALTSEGLARLHATAQQHVGDERVPGLVSLVASGDQVHVDALGSLAVRGAPVSRDSIFRIASTTKPITAAATLAVVAEGLVGLDEPVVSVELAHRVRDDVARQPFGAAEVAATVSYDCSKSSVVCCEALDWPLCTFS
ncbi:MAG: serine hydrolase [Actinomycetes bacterium]